MIPGAPHEARWIRPEARRTLSARTLDRIVRCAFGRCRVVEARPLTDGIRNTNLKVRLDTRADWVVVRVYEHDASLCQKEIDLIRLVSGSVPVPEVIHAEPRGSDGLSPFVVMRYVEGISFRDLMRGGDRTAIAQAAFSAGKTLVAIGRVTFQKSGWLAPGPAVTAPLLEGVDPTPRFLDLCLASKRLQPRVSAEVRDRIHALAWSWAPQLAGPDSQACLVHGDFGMRNLLVRCDGGQWAVAAVLDWEFAVSGSPLADLGHFLRYECASRAYAEPHFSDGYARAGGALPHEWRRLARLIDLAALCEMLTHDQLPDAVAAELVELACATVGNRDPRLK